MPTEAASSHKVVMAGTEKSMTFTLATRPKPSPCRAHLKISLTTASPTISLSADPTAVCLQLIIGARVVHSAYPASAITLCTDWSVLNNGQHSRHDGLFKGAIQSLQSTTDPNRLIHIAFAGSPNYARVPNIGNLRERSWTRFETIPPMGQGALIIKHDISLERLFRHTHNLKPKDIKPGEQFYIRMSPTRAFRCGWWIFGDMNDGDLKEKKFAEWVLPDENGEIMNLMSGEERPDVEQMEKDGWVFSQAFDNLEMSEDDEEREVVIEFLE